MEIGRQNPIQTDIKSKLLNITYSPNKIEFGRSVINVLQTHIYINLGQIYIKIDNHISLKRYFGKHNVF